MAGKSKKITKQLRRAYGSMILHVGDTDRLRIFSANFKPTPHNNTRRIVLAFRTDEDRPMVAATAVLHDTPTIGLVLDWLEVGSEHRRLGIGREFREFLTKKHGDFYSSAGSLDGARFRVALGLDDPETMQETA